ncbi:polysaccharide biosynthesis C-terminal domain-containing protein [Mariniflexile sp. AS56]|uniref:MATE family efflux transporter n=1 Tax=Mariniflexile sp. AS56 TaxID=3063957 RepID=UPI0026F18F30|nr:polysaccharide biosynthesis C-terminal domain-containing protein [Mariniflexile sp. AS56]MDO7172156.1 polysaccharide biosynthesis C-terminal domain-containing protein [Mariniflexile sp. AS56]
MKKLIKALKQHAYTQTIFTLALRGFGVLFLFGISFLMTNNFPPSVVGEYEFIRVFLLVTGSICLLGTDVSIIYFSGKLKALGSFSSIKKVYYSILKIVSVLSLVLVFLFFLFFTKENVNAFFEDSFYDIILKSFICLIFYVITLFNSETLRALDKTVLSELFRNIFKYVPLGIGIFLQIKYPSYLSISEYYVYGFVVLFLCSQLAVLYQFNNMVSTKHEQGYKAKDIIRISWPMGFSSFIMFLLLSVDVFLLKKHFGNDYVAYYAIAVKLITILSIIIISFNINVSPEIAELYSLRKTSSLQNTVADLAKKVFLINVFLALGMVIFIKPILLAFGSEYIVIKDTFYILIISQLFTSAFGVVPVYLNMTGRAKVYQAILIVSLIINIILNLILIPKYGINGAAFTFTFTVIFWNICVVVYVYRKDKIKLSFL